METRIQNTNTTDPKFGLEVKTTKEIDDQAIKTEELPGVFLGGVQYYDLKDVFFISNTGLANLIDVLKKFLKQGKDLVLVNVNKSIKRKIKALGLDSVLKIK